MFSRVLNRRPCGPSEKLGSLHHTRASPSTSPAERCARKRSLTTQQWVMSAASHSAQPAEDCQDDLFLGLRRPIFPLLPHASSPECPTLASGRMIWKVPGALPGPPLPGAPQSPPSGRSGGWPCEVHRLSPVLTLRGRKPVWKGQGSRKSNGGTVGRRCADMSTFRGRSAYGRPASAR